MPLHERPAGRPAVGYHNVAEQTGGQRLIRPAPEEIDQAPSGNLAGYPQGRCQLRGHRQRHSPELAGLELRHGRRERCRRRDETFLPRPERNLHGSLQLVWHIQQFEHFAEHAPLLASGVNGRRIDCSGLLERL